MSKDGSSIGEYGGSTVCGPKWSCGGGPGVTLKYFYESILSDWATLHKDFYQRLLARAPPKRTTRRASFADRDCGRRRRRPPGLQHVGGGVNWRAGAAGNMGGALSPSPPPTPLLISEIMAMGNLFGSLPSTIKLSYVWPKVWRWPGDLLENKEGLLLSCEWQRRTGHVLCEMSMSSSVTASAPAEKQRLRDPERGGWWERVCVRLKGWTETMCRLITAKVSM